MIETAREDLGLPQGGWIIGDAASDMELGRNSGLKTIMVLTGRGAEQLAAIRSTGAPVPDAVCSDLLAAAELILGHQIEQ